MSRAIIEEYIQLFNSAFEETEQSVIKNLESVRDENWDVLSDGARRSIKDIVAHIGMFKFMYPGSAFRDREYDYADDPVSPPAATLANRDSAMKWLRQAQKYLLEAFSTLEDDAELDAMRDAHWGGSVPTRRLMMIVLEHDTYHAGEINRARALLQNNDEWPDFSE